MQEGAVRFTNGAHDDEEVAPMEATGHRPRKETTERIALWTDGAGRVHIEVHLGRELEFRAMRRGGLREGLRLAQTFLDEGVEGFEPRPRGAEYIEIAQALASLGPGERFTSHRLAELLTVDGVHDRDLVLKNVSSGLTKLRKRDALYLRAAGKQGKSILYELTEPTTAAAVMQDLSAGTLPEANQE
jgi:hypothetical protein